MKKSEKKQLCTDCHDNRYNMGRGYCEQPGLDAPVTCDECWHLRTARIVDKLVYYSPNDYDPTLRAGTLTCWHNNFGTGDVIPGRRTREVVAS